MNTVITIVYISMLIFTGLIIYNIILTLREKHEKVQFRKSDADYDYSHSANWIKNVFKNFYDEEVYVFAGEFNFELYDNLLNDELLGIIKKNKLKLIAIGGPNISVPEKNYISKIVDWAKKDYLELYLRNDGKRIIGHGIVGSKHNKVCLLEDPHDEFKERQLTVFRNSFNYCNYLRDKVKDLLKPEVSFKVKDFSIETIGKYLKTKEELIATSEKVEDDERIKGKKLLLPETNTMLERRRLKCLAHIV